jgi:DegV family protein with EDD domain
MTVTVIADDAAAVPSELAKQLGVVLVPMQLEIDGRPVSTDRVALEEVVEHLDDGVQTSGPSPGAFAEVLQGVDGQDGSVVLTVAQRFSSTFQAATAAARLSRDGRSVRVVDTGSAAGGEGLVVLAAAEAAAAGRSVDDVVGVAEAVRSRVHLVAAVEHLTYLLRGGHVPASLGRLGDRIGVRVYFELQNSRIRPLPPSRTRTSAIDQLIGQWHRSRPHDSADRLHVAALHALRADDAETLLATIRQEVEPATSFVASFGPVMVAHTGPGLLGLAWWWQDAAVNLGNGSSDTR